MDTLVQETIFRCEGCGERLPAGRKTLRFHNSACRARFWRRKRDIMLHAEMIKAYIVEWMNTEWDDSEKRQVGQALDEILNAIGRDVVRAWADGYKAEVSL